MTPCPLHSMQVKRPRVAASPMSLSQAVGYREAGTWKPRKALPRKNDVRSTATSTRTRANASRSSRRSRECRYSTSWKPFSRTISVDGRSSTRSTSRRCARLKASQLASRAPRLKSLRRRVDQPQAVDLWHSEFRRGRRSRRVEGDRACVSLPSIRSNLSLPAAHGVYLLTMPRGVPCRARGLSDCARPKVNLSTHDNS